MQRLNFLSLSIATALAFVLATSAARAESIVWQAKMWGPSGRIPTELLETYAREVSRKTNGKVKIEITYKAASPRKVPEAIRDGEYQIGYSCPAYYPDKLPLSGVLDLPMFTPTDISALARVQTSVYEHPAVSKEMAQWNMRLLFPIPFPQYELMGKKRISKVSDFKGVKVRAGKGLGKVLSEYGAVPVMMPATEIGNSMAGGELDVVALPYYSSYVTYKVAEHSKYLTQNIALGVISCHFTVSKRDWDKLPSGIKKIMLDARSVALRDVKKETCSHDQKQLNEFKGQGVEIVEFPKSERARLLAKSAKYWNEWTELQDKAGRKGSEVFKFASNKIRQYARQ